MRRETSGVPRSAPALHVGDELVDGLGRRLALERVRGDQAVPEQRALVPEHALGEAGGAAGVPEQDVVARPLDAWCRCVGRDELLVVRVAAAVVDLDRVSDLRHPVPRGVDAIAERTVVHEHLGVGVVDQLHELVAEIAEVDVGRDRPELRQCEEQLHVLRGVVQEERDLRVLPHPVRGERGRETRRPVLHVAVRDPPLALHDGRRVGSGVGHPLPHGREALVHPATLRVPLFAHRTRVCHGRGYVRTVRVRRCPCREGVRGTPRGTRATTRRRHRTTPVRR